MNDIATTQAGGAVGALQSLKSGMSNVKTTLPVQGGIPIMRMLRDGTWVYGQENYEVEDESLWAFNPMSLQHGFVCFDSKDEGGGGKLLGEVLVTMNEPLPAKDSLPKHDFPWNECLSIGMKCVSGEDKGEEAVYKPSSHGGKQAGRGLIDAIIMQLDADPTNIVPVVEMESSHYQHKTWGKTYTPVLSVRKWADMNGDMFDETEADETAPAKAEPEPVEQAEPKQEAAPKTRTRKRKAAAAPAAETEPVGETIQVEPETSPAETASTEGAPRRRRRRNAA